MRLFSDKMIQPLVSEKSKAREDSLSEFTVVVDKKMNKIDIAKAVEKLFGVKPLAIRTAVFRKKTKNTRYGEVPTRDYKKAMIRLAKGQRLELK